MKATATKIDYRIKVKPNKTVGIQSYDCDNIYPQRVREMVKSSGTASNCVNAYAKFITGSGFKDQYFYKQKINSKGLTPDKLLRKSAEDYAMWHGFAWLVSYDAFLNVNGIFHVPFEFCRLVDPENEEYSGKIAVYDDWDKQKRTSIDSKKIDFIHAYNPDKEVILQEIEDCGGIQNYKGQLMWYSIEKEYYPLAIYDPVLEDIVTNAGIKNYRLRNVKTNFMPSQMLEYPGEFETEDERNEFIAVINSFQGDDNSNKVMLLENKYADVKPFVMTKFDVQDNDKMFMVTNQTSKDSIIEIFSIPPILVGVQVAGKLGSSQDLQDGYNYYNLFTTDDRLLFEEKFKDVCSRFKTNLNPSLDYSILPLSYANASDNTALISVLGVGGTQALTAILESATLQPVQKVNTLKVVFGISQHDAEAMVNITVQP